jgi:hypothetical protein
MKRTVIEYLALVVFLVLAVVAVILATSNANSTVTRSPTADSTCATAYVPREKPSFVIDKSVDYFPAIAQVC